MNDPGLDGPIQEDAKIVENRREEDEMDEAEEDEQSFLAPRCVFPCLSVTSYSTSSGDERAASCPPFHLWALYDERSQTG